MYYALIMKRREKNMIITVVVIVVLFSSFLFFISKKEEVEVQKTITNTKKKEQWERNRDAYMENYKQEIIQKFRDVFPDGKFIKDLKFITQIEEEEIEIPLIFFTKYKVFIVEPLLSAGYIDTREKIKVSKNYDLDVFENKKKIEYETIKRKEWQLISMLPDKFGNRKVEKIPNYFRESENKVIELENTLPDNLCQFDFSYLLVLSKNLQIDINDIERCIEVHYFGAILEMLKIDDPVYSDEEIDLLYNHLINL